MLARKPSYLNYIFFRGDDVYGRGDEPCVTLLVIMYQTYNNIIK